MEIQLIDTAIHISKQILLKLVSRQSHYVNNIDAL